MLKTEKERVKELIEKLTKKEELQHETALHIAETGDQEAAEWYFGYSEGIRAARELLEAIT